MFFHVHGIILRDQPFREHDRIFSLYTKERGKLEIRAVGVRKIRSRLVSQLALPKISQFFLVNSRFLPKVIGVVSLKNLSNIFLEEEAIQCTRFLLYLVDRFTKEGVIDEEIFFLLQISLEDLNELARSGVKDAMQYEELARVFFLSFVSLLGYSPKREQCFLCRHATLLEERFVVEQNIVLCRLCTNKFQFLEQHSHVYLSFIHLLEFTT